MPEYVHVRNHPGSKTGVYKISVNKDLSLEKGEVLLSCNCPSYTKGRHNKGVEVRSCKHTDAAYSLINMNISSTFDPFNDPIPSLWDAIPMNGKNHQIFSNFLGWEISRHGKILSVGNVTFTKHRVSCPRCGNLYEFTGSIGRCTCGQRILA